MNLECFEISVKIEPECEPKHDPPVNSVFTTEIKVEPLDNDDVKPEIIFPSLEIKQEPGCAVRIVENSESKENKTQSPVSQNTTGSINQNNSSKSVPSKLQKSKHTEELTCHLCRKTITNKKKYEHHILEHSTELKLTCVMCNKKYLSRKDLVHHFFDRHVNDHECKICNTVFASKTILEDHLITHSGTTYSCDLCMEDFERKTYLVIHLRKNHVGGSLYVCKYCSKEFETPSGLMNHEATHTKKASFCCDVCGVTFSKGSKLTRHMTIHTGEKRTKCVYCERRFMRIVDLKRHELTHIGSIKNT